MARIGGIQLAPLNIPLRRRLQTLAVLYYLFIGMWMVPIGILLPLYILFCTKYWPLMIVYFLWMYCDWNSPKTGGYTSQWARSMRINKFFASYFPAKLHKTCDLDPGHNYLIGYHPHGIISMGCFASFITDSTGFSRLYPDIQLRVCTLVGQFWIPFRREWGLLHGLIDCSRQSLDYLLARGGGRAAVLVVGGAEEALDAHPGQHILTLKKRKGFIQMAIKTGAHLVPAYSFGENELFDQVDNPKGSLLRTLQTSAKNHLTYSPPLFYGRGIFNYNCGLLPFRRPINTVVGKPIFIVKNENPSRETIDRVHTDYVEQLRQLFDENKTKFGLSEDIQLVIQ